MLSIKQPIIIAILGFIVGFMPYAWKGYVTPTTTVPEGK